jgi:hypothetical protein
MVQSCFDVPLGIAKMARNKPFAAHLTDSDCLIDDPARARALNDVKAIAASMPDIHKNTSMQAL